MAKGKKRDYSLPAGVTSRVEQSKLAKKWKKGVNTRVEEFEFKQGGYFQIPDKVREYQRFFYDEFGELGQGSPGQATRNERD